MARILLRITSFLRLAAAPVNSLHQVDIEVLEGGGSDIEKIITQSTL